MFYQMATTQALAKHPTLYRTETKYTGKKKKNNPASHVATQVVVESGKAKSPVKGGNGVFWKAAPGQQGI